MSLSLVKQAVQFRRLARSAGRNLPAVVALLTVAFGLTPEAQQLSKEYIYLNGRILAVEYKLTLSVLTSSLPNGQVSAAYPSGTTLQASGGTTPYSWSVSSGSLSPGLSLNTTSGAITGTPTTAGSYILVAKVTDAASNVATQQFTLVISPATLTISSVSVPNGQVTVAYTATTLQASGGTTP